MCKTVDTRPLFLLGRKRAPRAYKGLGTRLVKPLLNHPGFYSVFKADITAAERLTLTLRYLATGNSQVSTKFRFELL